MADGLQLIEVAPGIDIERDVLPHMKFRPVVRDVGLMSPRIFSPEPMGLRDRMLDLDLTDRLAYDSERNLLFINREGLHIRRIEDLEAMPTAIVAFCQRVAVATMMLSDSTERSPIAAISRLSSATRM